MDASNINESVTTAAPAPAQDTTTSAAPGEPPPALETGSFIELHGLSREDMNGLMGELVGLAQDRFMVKLDDTKNTIKVKPINVKRIPLQPMNIRQQAMKLASDGMNKDSLTEMRTLCLQSIELDRCCVLGYIGLGQCSMQQGQRFAPQACMYLQRAVAQSYAASPFLPATTCTRLRLELATCLGEAGRVEQETAQLQQLLEIEPHFVHAMYALGLSLGDQDRKDESIVLYQRVLNAPATDESGLNIPKEIVDLKRRAYSGMIKCLVDLVMSTGNAVGDNETVEREYEKCLEYCAQALQIENLDPANEVKLLVYKGYVLAYKAKVLGHEGCWDESVEYIRRAREMPVSPMSKSFVAFQAARIQEMSGDNALPNEAFARYQEALALYEESEEFHTNPATRESFMRVQAKLHPDMETVIDPDTGGCIATPTKATGVTLEELPDGPTHPPEQDAFPDKVDFLGERPRWS